MPKSVFSISEDHAKALGHKEGFADCNDRESHVIDILNKELNSNEKKALVMYEYVAGFLLGYTLRGFDNALDFTLTDEEILGSVKASFVDMKLEKLPTLALCGMLEKLKEADNE